MTTVVKEDFNNKSLKELEWFGLHSSVSKQVNISGHLPYKAYISNNQFANTLTFYTIQQFISILLNPFFFCLSLLLSVCHTNTLPDM